MPAYFTNEFNAFFKELAANNHKEWFDENRKRYHSHIKDPFYAFVRDLIGEIQQRDSDLDVDVKSTVFRINNDIRFHKNKPLYKTHVGASIANRGRKNMEYPGFYVHLSPGECFIAIGCYKPSKEALIAIREGIITDLSRFRAVLDDEVFQDVFGDLADSERNKVLPKEWREAALLEPLLYNKQFYAQASYEDGEAFVTQENLMQEVIRHYEAGQEFLEYLKEFTGI